MLALAGCTGEQGGIHRVNSPYYGQAWAQRHRHATRGALCKGELGPVMLNRDPDGEDAHVTACDWPANTLLTTSECGSATSLALLAGLSNIKSRHFITCPVSRHASQYYYTSTSLGQLPPVFC